MQNAVRTHFDHVSEEGAKFTFSSLLGGMADRAAASPDKALTLRRAPVVELQKAVAQGLVQYEREVTSGDRIECSVILMR